MFTNGSRFRSTGGAILFLEFPSFFFHAQWEFSPFCSPHPAEITISQSHPSCIVLRTRNAAVVEVVGRQLAALLLELHAIALPGQRSNGLEEMGFLVGFLVDLWCVYGGFFWWICGELDGEWDWWWVRWWLVMFGIYFRLDVGGQVQSVMFWFSPKRMVVAAASLLVLD